MKKGKAFLDILQKAYSSDKYCIVDKDKEYVGCKSVSLDENKMTVEYEGEEKVYKIDQITMKNVGGVVHYILKTQKDKKEPSKKKKDKKEPSKKKEDKPPKEDLKKDESLKQDPKKESFKDKIKRKISGKKSLKGEK